jgi:signal transduction histidine kinase
VRVDVIDNGPGIPPERHQQIFQPFQTTKGLRGTGLGLVVTKRIVEEHQGRIVLQSIPGRGAAFSLILPADNKGPADPSATTGARPTGDDAFPML